MPSPLRKNEKRIETPLAHSGPKLLEPLFAFRSDFALRQDVLPPRGLASLVEILIGQRLQNVMNPDGRATE